MAGKYLILICTIICCITNSLAQTFYQYGDKTFGGNLSEINCYINYFDAHTFIIGGESLSDISGDKTVSQCDTTTSSSDVWMLKIDTAFNILWQKDYGGDMIDGIPFFSILQNRNLTFVGFSRSNDTCDKTEPNFGNPSADDYWYVVCDSNGNKLYDKSLGGSGVDTTPKSLEVQNNEILICGVSNITSTGDEKTTTGFGVDDYWCLALDSNGTKLWDKVFGGSSWEEGSKLFGLSLLNSGDGNIFLVGSTQSTNSGNITANTHGLNDVLVVKMDYNGNILWNNLYGGDNNDWSNSAYLTNDNGLIICGTTNSNQYGDVSENPKGIRDMWIIKLDSAGNKQWDKRFGGSGFTYGVSIRPDDEGGYWVAGNTNSDSLFDVSQPGYGDFDYWVLKIDSVGNKLWDKRFGSAGKDEIRNFVILPDSSIILSGQAGTGTSDVKTDIGKGLTDYWLVHFKYGSLPTGIPTVSDQNQITVYPNPSTGELNLPNEVLQSNLFVFDVAGRIVYKIESLQTTNLDLDFLPTGCYFLQFQNKTALYNSRWVKM